MRETHWVCGQLNLVDWHLTVYDSLVCLTTDAQLASILCPLTENLVDLLSSAGYWRSSGRPRVTSPISWTRLPAADIPQQLSGSGDCGVMTCMYIEHLAFGQPFQFTGADCHAYRRRMAVSLYSGELQ